VQPGTDAGSGPPAARSTPGPRPVAQQSIVDFVIDEVRRSILDGSLRPGSPISIADLGSDLNVSHIPVREALRRLEGEGLIELRRGRSAIVAALSRDDLADVSGMRALLEADVMARAVALYDAADIAAIEAAWTALEVRSGDDVETLSRRHRAFHELLLGPALTEWSTRLLDMVWQAGDRYLHLVLAEAMSSSPTRLRDEHRSLLDAARQRSRRAARKAVLDHLHGDVALIGPILDRPSR
jgi:DNA-binding GntR family transcriptional regulator